MTGRPIYFDYMATTPVDKRVVEKMLLYLDSDGIFGNAGSASHCYGREAALAVEHARAQIAQSLYTAPDSIVFTSGATEANNLAILGAARFYSDKGRHLITMTTEHKAVLDSFKKLEQEGFSVTYLNPKPDGLLDLNELADALTPNTILVSIMQVNNEIGVIQDIEAIGNLLNDRGILFHVDAAQSAGKIEINLQKLQVNLMSFSAHKNYGPKGIGALYVQSKPRIRLFPLSFGGGHEGGLRSGTLATHQIVGMGEAFAIGFKEQPEEQKRIAQLRNKLWNGIKSLPGIHLNGHPDRRIAGNLNFSFSGIAGESLVFALNQLAISTTSACSSASAHPSYVLKALGLSDYLCFSSIRLAIGRFTQEKDIEFAVDTICEKVQYLHDISPL